MAFYSQDQIAKAREMDLLTYLQRYEPWELVHEGGKTYSTRKHDSLKISNGKWMWMSRKFGGSTALDFLVKVRGMKFTDAVAKLIGTEAAKPVHRGNYFFLQGRELLTPDEVRMLDNRYALLFIRGERPVMDLKYDILHHPNVAFTTDGKGEVYRHGEATGARNTIELSADLLELVEETEAAETGTSDYLLMSEEDIEQEYL